MDWNFVDEDNAILNVPDGNSFCSSHMDPERLDGGGIGEIRQLFYSKSQNRAPGFMNGARRCGSDFQWSHGYPATDPSVTYVGGFPACCDPDGAAFTRGFDMGFDA